MYEISSVQVQNLIIMPICREAATTFSAIVEGEKSSTSTGSHYHRSNISRISTQTPGNYSKRQSAPTASAVMGSEKYKLKWSKYESNILSAFHGLLESENLSDVTLFCEGQSFKAHRLVLAACSTHFETLFSHGPGVNGTPLQNPLFVILDGTRADDLQILLHFMYRGEAYLHQDRINSVLRTAEVLQVKGLSEGPKNIEFNNSGNRSWSPGPPPPENSSPSRTHHSRKIDPSLLHARRLTPPRGNTDADGGSGNTSAYPPYSREPFPMFSSSQRGTTSSYRRDDNLHQLLQDRHHNNYSPPLPSSQQPHRSKSPPPLTVPHSAVAAAAVAVATSGGNGRSPYHSSNSSSSSAKFIQPPAQSAGGNANSERPPSRPGSKDNNPVGGSVDVDMYEVRSSSSRGVSGNGNDQICERPSSNKTDHRLSPTATTNEYNNERSSVSKFPSDSTTAPNDNQHHHRVRRASDPGGLEVDEERSSVASDEHPRSSHDYRDSPREELNRLGNHNSPDRSTGK